MGEFITAVVIIGLMLCYGSWLNNDITFTPSALEGITQCANNGGVSTYTIANGNHIEKVVCNNGAVFEFYRSKKDA